MDNLPKISLEILGCKTLQVCCSSCLWCSIQVNYLVSIILCSCTIFELLHWLLYNLKLSPEKCVFRWVHLISISFQKVCINTRNSLYKTLKRGRNLDLLEKTSNDTACSCS